MTRVAIVGAAAIPCARLQAARDAPLQVLEHEALAGCVIGAMRDAGLPKESVGALVFSHPRPCTEQRYFGTFMANYLRIASDGVLMEVLGNGMTGGLAFDQAAQAIAAGHADVALALGVNFETATPSAEHMTLTMRATGVRIATRLLGVKEGFGVGLRAAIVVQQYDDGPLFAARVENETQARHGEYARVRT